MPEIKWLPKALADIERLHHFLKTKNPEAASRAIRTIIEGAGLLRQSPRLGLPMPDESGRRELFLPFASGAYVLRYKPDADDTPIIIRVWHSREDRQ